MNERIGTLAWARETGGQLNSAESRSLLAVVLKAQLTIIPDEWLHKLGLRRPRDLAIDFETLAPPDTAGCNAARKACRAASPDYLTNHSERSYWWGRILAQLAGLKPDPELLYAAAMFHDLGLTDSHGGVSGRAPCFTLASIAPIPALLAPLGWDAQRIDTVCEAITLHLNVSVDIAFGAEAHLLNQATALDVTGMRRWRVQPALRRRVLELHPRSGQNAALSACWKAEAARFLNTRAAWLEKNVQFSKRIARAPFES